MDENIETNIMPESTKIKTVPIVISITSEQALRKLLADDPGLELNIKKTITINIAKSFDKLLKAYEEKIINSVSVSNVLGKVQDEFTSHYLTTEITRWNGFDQKIKVLKPEICELIDRAVNDTLRAELIEMKAGLDVKITNEMASLYERVQRAYDRMDAVVKEFEDAVVKDVTSEAMNKEVEARVTARLEAIRKGL